MNRITHYDQVIDALKKIGRWANFKDICKKLKQMEAKIPEASVRMYISSYWQTRNLKKNPIKVKKDKNNNTSYMLDKSIPYSNSRKIGGKIKNTNDNKPSPKENILYFICLNPVVKIPAAESLFKIGQTGNIGTRMNAYNSSLPFEPIQQIDIFQIPIEIDLQEIEDELRTRLLSSKDLGINMYRNGKHKEWLQKHSFDVYDKEQREQLVKKVKHILDDIIKKKSRNP
ncbi:MAG: GIY-YIG nuclease family protein [Fibromonadaceae bacterium]|jgi:hypothetical protein|nr:GIY-YIG nuclease family protein [Fibromonadaceae bacterium]